MNKDIKRRDEIIFGNYTPDRYRYGGCANTDVTANIVQQLLDEDFIELNECQNDSPSTKEFLQEIKGLEEYVTFEIYAIDDDREDYRVTIEGIRTVLPVSMRKDFLRLCTAFGYADEFHVYEDENENLVLRAWWD